MFNVQDESRGRLSVVLFCIFYSSFIVLAGCEKNPTSKLVNPSSSNTIGSWTGSWTLYDDELKTGGAVMLYTETDGVEIDFNDTDAPRVGSKCLKFSWDGREVTAYSNPPEYPSDYRESDFVGFGLIVAKQVSDYEETTKDLSQGGFRKVSFWAKGSLNTDVSVKIEIENTSGQATSIKLLPSQEWVYYEYDVNYDIAVIKDYAKILMVYDEDGDPQTANAGRGNGGTVYFDEIKISQ
ncbi:MAG: hypothetical protein JW803_06535 [Endomicrobiales bacterium]|nr:hypothetical protein [Endomicrobiales bacterium]